VALQNTKPSQQKAIEYQYLNMGGSSFDASSTVGISRSASLAGSESGSVVGLNGGMKASGSGGDGSGFVIQTMQRR
jgi:hypothetical protein